MTESLPKAVEINERHVLFERLRNAVMLAVFRELPYLN